MYEDRGREERSRQGMALPAEMLDLHGETPTPRQDRQKNHKLQKKKTDRQKKTSLRKKESASKSSIPEYARGRDASVR